MNQKISIIDYGVGNLLNVVRAFEHCGVSVEVVESAKQINNSGHLVLPGVGAFPDGMHELHQRGLVDAIKYHVASDKPLLGICLGMQMLFDSSEEFGGEDGLGIIDGVVVAVPEKGENGLSHKIPHIGWNELIPAAGKNWSGTVLSRVQEKSAVYFVHSFMAEPTSGNDLLAFCDYDGCKITAAVQRDNVIGCQFHPEKSAELGLDIIRGFISI